MIAKLVLVSFMTRVIVEDNASESEIIEAAKPKIAQKVQTELYDNLEEITNDTECPFDPLTDKVNR